ncbi:MAG TPA: MBL fold metallo-hydrolase [Steroidobacteraceae bacterium]|nr:MBL fold metallo-hydrolase [Steroidobacteraceae bacterium]
MRVTFLGAAGAVTGSKYLLELGPRRVLIDCGLFQGLKRLRERNWQPLPFDPQSLDAVLLTHAHIDHSGYLPVLVRAGYRGPVYCTEATRRLLSLMLPDAARLQEEEAEYANRHRYSKHSPALPLYTEADARAALERLHPVALPSEIALFSDLQASFSRAGHLLGAASVRLESRGERILFSGDLGRTHDPLMRAPAAAPPADWVVIESTYGDRLHSPVDPESELVAPLDRTLARGGVAIVPTFAIGRAQLLLYLIGRLKKTRAIPDVPVYLNSPMAEDATPLYQDYPDEHRLTAEDLTAMTRAAHFVTGVEESKALNRRSGPMIILAASGMATGGRVVHHLKAFAPDPRNMILFTGYQAAGTRGAAMLAGAESIKCHGEWVPVRAEVVQLHGTSSHADYRGLIAWLAACPSPPRRVFVTHGEPAAADALRQHLRRAFELEVTVPEQGERFASE